MQILQLNAYLCRQNLINVDYGEGKRGIGCHTEEEPSTSDGWPDGVDGCSGTIHAGEGL